MLFLLLSPPAKWLHRDVTMHAIHFGDRREVYLLDESSLPVTEKKVGERGKEASALIQTNGSAYSTFHLCPFVPVRHTHLYPHVCFKKG